MSARSVVKFYAGVAVGMIMIGASGVASANLITNGSFELGSFTDPDGDSAMSLSVGSTAITGWTVVNGEIAWEKVPNPWGVSASDGIYYLDLTGFHDSSPYGGVYQNISTIVGSFYTLSFDMGIDERWPGSVSVTATVGGNSQVFTINSSTGSQWNTFSFNFVADVTTTQVSLVGTGSGTCCYIGLDNISIDLNSVPIPEPTTMLLFGSGITVLVGSRLKRRKR